MSTVSAAQRKVAAPSAAGLTRDDAAERRFFWYNFSMNESFKDIAVRYLTYFVLALIVVVCAMMMYPDYRRSESLKQQNAELQEQIDRRTREIAQLVENQRRFKTDADFVEKIARQNHRVFPGELIFIFDKD